MLFCVQGNLKAPASLIEQIIENIEPQYDFFLLPGLYRHITNKLFAAGILAIPHHDLVAEAFRGVVDQNDDPQR